MRRLLALMICLWGFPVLAQDALPPAVMDFAAVTTPCETESNVDTCWLRGSDLLKSNPAAAVMHFEMSCAFRSQYTGCYEAAKLYLLDRTLRNYTRANTLFARACLHDDTGFAPYACKYLGWMSLTGVGSPKDDVRAQALLEQSCFTPLDNPFVDAEGCALLGDYLIARGDLDQAFRAFLAFAMGCLDGVSSLCTTAEKIVYAASMRSDPWVPDCTEIPSPDVLAALTCTDLPRLAILADSTIESEANENSYLRDVIKERVLYLNEDLNFEGEAN
jgi:hypothetical protein